MEKIAELEENDTALFIVWLMRRAGFDAQIEPLLSGGYKEIIGVDFYPKWALVVPKSQLNLAERVYNLACEFNWDEKLWKERKVDKRMLDAFLKKVEKEKMR